MSVLFTGDNWNWSDRVYVSSPWMIHLTLRRRGSQRGQRWAGKSKEDNVCWGIGPYIEGKKEGAENLFIKAPGVYLKLILALNPLKEKNVLK